MPITLIGGGSRSGKSRFALEYARKCGSRLAFIATAQLYDDEMRSRAAAHQAERGTEFATIEEPLDLASALANHCGSFDAIVVDCLTLWVTNVMLNEALNIEPESDRMLAAAVVAKAHVIFVTNEVGSGIVPDNALARRFRDLAGTLNQRVAQVATEVYFMAFGCSLRLK